MKAWRAPGTRGAVQLASARLRPEAVAIALLVVTVVLGFLLTTDSPKEVKGLFVLGMMLCLMALKVPVAVAMGGSAALGIWVFTGLRAMGFAFRDPPFVFITSWSLSVLPLFLLMGIVLWRAGITERVYAATRAWLYWLPGGLGIATNFAGAMLAAASGSTLAIALALGRVAVPEMLRAGYNKGFSVAVVAMAGTLGQVIPPSILLVIYAGIVEQSVGPQLLAGFVPGVMLAFFYAAMIVVRAIVDPNLGGRGGVGGGDVRLDWNARLRVGIHVWPIFLVLLIILGGLYSGVFTATEAGAFGVLGAVVAAFVYAKRQALRALWLALGDTASIMGSILFLLAGVAILTRFLALSGTAEWMADVISDLGLGRISFLLTIMVLYLILGMFMDALPILLLTVPVFMPALEALEISLIWYGVFAVIMANIAMVTPPVGIVIYVLHRLVANKEVTGGVEIGLVEVFMGVTWFVVASLVGVVVLIVFPDIALWLPRAAGMID